MLLILNRQFDSAYVKHRFLDIIKDLWFHFRHDSYTSNDDEDLSSDDLSDPRDKRPRRRMHKSTQSTFDAKVATEDLVCRKIIYLCFKAVCNLLL